MIGIAIQNLIQAIMQLRWVDMPWIAIFWSMVKYPDILRDCPIENQPSVIQRTENLASFD